MKRTPQRKKGKSPVVKTSDNEAVDRWLKKNGLTLSDVLGDQQVIIYKSRLGYHVLLVPEGIYLEDRLGYEPFRTHGLAERSLPKILREWYDLESE